MSAGHKWELNLSFAARGMKAEFLEFLQEASTGQPWDQEPQRHLTSATGNVTSVKQRAQSL